MTTNQDIIDQVSRRLRDVNKKTWKLDVLLAAMNSAFQSIVNVRPDSNTVHRDIALAPGHEQQIDDDLYKIIHALHNVDDISGKPRRAITLANMGTMDSVFMHWRLDKPRGYVEHYMLDEMDDKKFYVWPPVIGPRPGEEPLLPEVPVNPGTVNTTGNLVEVDAYYVDLFGDNDIILEWPDGNNNARQSVNGAVPPGTNSLMILNFRNSPEPWNTRVESLGGIRDVIETNGTHANILNGIFPPNASSMGIGPTGSGSGVYFDSDNEIFIGPTKMLVTNTSFDKFHIEDNDFTPVTITDAQNYAELLNVYNRAVADRNAYFTQEGGDTIRIVAAMVPCVEESQLEESPPLNKSHIPALMEWMLYYCYAIDDELTANNARADVHFRNFFNLMDSKIKNSLRIQQIRNEVDA